MVGTTISHFKIIEKLGKGGMGEASRRDNSQINVLCKPTFLNTNSCRWIADAIVGRSRLRKMVSRTYLLGILAAVGLFMVAPLHAQSFLSVASVGDVEQVTVWDNLIILELGADELQPENLFDLEGKTLRYTPEGPRFQVQSVPFQWDSDFGSALTAPRSDSAEVTLTNFDFPFSGISWDSFFVNLYGNITFTGPQRDFFEGGRTRSVPMRNYGKTMIGRAPIVSPLFRPFLPITPSVTAYAKELPDRIVITWEVEEAFGFSRYFGNEGANRFQAVLHETGEIDFSYETILVRDGVVGIFPQGGVEEELGTINDPIDTLFPAHLDIVSVTASLIGTRFVRFDVVLRDLLPEGDPRVDATSYTVNVDLEEPFTQNSFSRDIDLRFGVLGTTDQTYRASGDPITNPQVTMSGNTFSFTTGLESFNGVDRVSFITTADDDLVVDHTTAITVDLPPFFEPQVEDLSEISEAVPAREVIYEEFYYPDVLGNPEEGDGHAAVPVCEVIEKFGDVFDFIVLYTDFRIDRTTPNSSTIAVNSEVTGLGRDNETDPVVFCSDGQFQGGMQPAYIGAPRFAEDDGFSGARLRSNYDYHLNLLMHELGHRWLAPRYVRIGGQRVEIGNINGHWQIGLDSPAAFRAPRDPRVDDGWPASVMGVYDWQDNGDGTFTPLDDPGGPGYSYLDLYLMGLVAEQDVPDFFVIQNLELLGNGNWSGNRINLTIGNYIAENGPRLPAFEDSQKEFNIGFVGIVQSGEPPSSMMIERMAGIRQVWLDYWPTATGGVSTMTSSPYPPTTLIANFMNGNTDAFNSRVYLWNPSESSGDVTVRVFTLPPPGGTAQELTTTPLNLGTLEARSALNIKLAEDVLTPLRITTPYTDNDGDLTLEFTITAANVRGATQVFSSSLAFGTNPLQEIPSTSSGSPTVLVANFMNGNNDAFSSRVYLFNPSQSAGNITVRVFTLPLNGGTTQELTGTPLDLGTLGSRSALSVKLVEDILTPLGITTPYITDGGNLTLEFTIEAADVRAAAQVFSSTFAFGVYPLQEIPSTSSGSPTVLVANFMNGNDAAFNSRVYLWNPSASAGNVMVRVFTLPLTGGAALELTGTPLVLGPMGAKSALNVKVAEDILTPLGITTPYTTDGGNLTLEFTIEAADVRGAAQVFSNGFAFGTNPLQEIPSTSSGSPTVLVANFMNGNNDALNSRVYLWNPSASAGDVTVRVFSLPLNSSTAQELTGIPLSLGTLGVKSARNIKLAEDILTPLGITTPYITDGGNLTLEFTIQAADVVGAAQVFSFSFAFGTYALQEIK